MTNRERFAEQILNIACSGRLLAVEKSTLEPIACENTNCEKCYFGRNPTDECITECKKWCNAEYVEPPARPPVDWGKVPVDTPVLVRNLGKLGWKHRYFAKYENGQVYAWCNGSTSWSKGCGDTGYAWEYAKLAEESEQ